MKSCSEEIFDFHVHLLGDSGLDGEFLSFAKEERMPFAVSCLGPDGHMLADPTVDECRRANDMVLALVEEHPDLAYPFCYTSPLHGQQAIEEMHRCVHGHGMVGVKLWIACPCSDERATPIVEEATALGVPVLQHAFLRVDGPLGGESTPKDVATLASRCPEARIIMAHMSLRWREGVDAIAGCSNVQVDTSGFDPEMGSVEYATQTLGPNRVLYGSDAPGRDVLCQIGRVLAAEISEDDRRKVLWENARSLLGVKR